MSLLCRWVQRGCARRVVNGSPMWAWQEEHLARCAACARSAGALGVLARALAGSLGLSEPSDSFTEAVMSRLDVRLPTTPRRWKARLAGWHALVGAVVLGAVALTAPVRPPAPPPGRAGSPHSRPGPSVARTSRSPMRLAPAPLPRSRPRPRHGERVHSRRLPRHRLLAVQPARPTPTPAPAQPADALVWIRWAGWLEAHGDYRRAAAAWSALHRAGAGPVAGFRAGRAAECAGDVQQAVEHYSQLLDPEPQPAPEQEKGTRRWIDDESAA